MKSATSLKLLAGFVALVLVAGGATFALSPGKNQGYAPAQPIPFSHQRHAGQFNIPCMYCHTTVEKSRHASVPAMNVCMNCHRLVKTESPYIKQLTESYDAGKPIPWIKVHDLPDFTFFNHKRHIARGVQCQTCHGDVQNMERIKQVAPLTMGWCVNCHRQPEYNAPTSCDTCHR
ncbi:MAG: cytochrome c3 family protein [Oligoflexia bacterium]|nr:cytochrome c3 family protein [Oligoflexia bacterium]